MPVAEGPKSDRVAVVVNGNAKRVTDDLVEVLDQIVQSGDLFVSRSVEEGREIAHRIVEQGYPVVLTGGGDGTFVQMVTAITHESKRHDQEPPRFGLLKLGTGNAIAWVLGAQNPRGRGVVADLARLRRSGGHNTLRLLEVEGMLTPFAGVGGDAVGVQHFNEVKSSFQHIPVLRKHGMGALAYAVSIIGRTVPTFLLKSKTQVRIVNEGEPVERVGDDGQVTDQRCGVGETVYEGPCHAVMMSTIPYWGFGSRIFPFAGDRDDRFNLRIMDFNPLLVPRHLHSIWNGTYRHPRLLDFFAQGVSLHFDRPEALQIGGDAAGTHQIVHARLYPEPIKVVDYYAPPPVD